MRIIEKQQITYPEGELKIGSYVLIHTAVEEVIEVEAISDTWLVGKSALGDEVLIKRDNHTVSIKDELDRYLLDPNLCLQEYYRLVDSYMNHKRA